MRHGVTAYTIDRRLSKLELSLGMRETPAMAYSRELLTYWLATSEDGAELLALYEDMWQSFGAISMFTTQVGRDLTMDVLDDLYETLEP